MGYCTWAYVLKVYNSDRLRGWLGRDDKSMKTGDDYESIRLTCCNRGKW